MRPKLRAAARLMLLLLATTLSIACTTKHEQVQQAGINVEPAIVSVSTPGLRLPQGTRFAWLSSAIHLYKDERLDSTTIQFLIEKSIKTNLADRGYSFVEAESAADYTIAYTAALESSLDDAEILRRFGLVPGNMRTPGDHATYEKGTLVIYAFDNSTGDVIWRSAVQASVDFSLDAQERKQRIEPIIKDMFQSFPKT